MNALQFLTEPTGNVPADPFDPGILDPLNPGHPGVAGYSGKTKEKVLTALDWVIISFPRCPWRRGSCRHPLTALKQPGTVPGRLRCCLADQK